MKLSFAVAIFALWSTLSTANDVDFSEFPNHVDVSLLQCQDNSLSINFSNAVILQIGRDFISSPIITCLDLTNNHIEGIAEGAFEKLPKLTDLYLSSNKFTSSEKLFTFGGHPTLKVLALDRTVYTGAIGHVSNIPGSYPNLETLTASKNTIVDLTSNQNSPFAKLKTLDLSGNNIKYTNFVKLLPQTLTNLYLQDNLLTSLKPGNSLVTLILDNNNLLYLRKHSNNSAFPGLWLAGLKNLMYLSVFGNKIRTVESVSFQDTIKLTSLNLSKNEIDFLYPETFANLQFLTVLDLSRNRLQKVPDISHETNIISLYLSCNNIKQITGHVFARTPKLKELSLDRNQIDHVDVNGFAYLYYLEKLSLSSNKLSSLPTGWSGAFSSLKSLDLSNNQFTSLESLSLSNKLPLVNLYLTSNPIHYLGAGSFKNLPQNLTVDFVHGLYTSNIVC